MGKNGTTPGGGKEKSSSPKGGGGKEVYYTLREKMGFPICKRKRSSSRGEEKEDHGRNWELS